MNIGSLKHRIEFQSLEETYDKEGFPIEDYVTFQKAWADVNDLYGKENWISKQNTSEKITTFYIRYYKNIDINCFILFNKQRYEILEIDNIFKDLDNMNISDKKKRNALKIGAEIVRQSVVDNSPVLTGMMKKRWKSNIKRFDGNLGFEIRGDTPQDIENEFGSSRNKKHIGFFSKAVDKVSNVAVKVIADEVLK